MQKTAWLIFDLGGVLFDFHGVAGISKLTGWAQEAAHEALVNSPAVHALETGENGPEKFGEQFAEELGVSISSPDMVEIWASWLAGPKPGSLELLGALREQGPIACLTNNNSIHWALLGMRHNVDKLFDKCFLSQEIGFHKPDRRIFEHVVADLGLRPTEITYFDDRLDIVNSAMACGLNAHQVTSPEQIRAVIGED